MIDPSVVPPGRRQAEGAGPARNDGAAEVHQRRSGRSRSVGPVSSWPRTFSPSTRDSPATSSAAGSSRNRPTPGIRRAASSVCRERGNTLPTPASRSQETGRTSRKSAWRSSSTSRTLQRWVRKKEIETRKVWSFMGDAGTAKKPKSRNLRSSLNGKFVKDRNLTRSSCSASAISTRRSWRMWRLRRDAQAHSDDARQGNPDGRVSSSRP